jgi:hypothetical protein
LLRVAQKYGQRFTRNPTAEKMIIESDVFLTFYFEIIIESQEVAKKK